MLHTFWSCLIRCANMKWIQLVLWKIQSKQDFVHRRTDRRTDGRHKTSIPPFESTTSNKSGIQCQMFFHNQGPFSIYSWTRSQPNDRRLACNVFFHWQRPCLAIDSKQALVSQLKCKTRADSKFAPSQWETSLQSNSMAGRKPIISPDDSRPWSQEPTLVESSLLCASQTFLDNRTNSPPSVGAMIRLEQTAKDRRSIIVALKSWLPER